MDVGLADVVVGDWSASSILRPLVNEDDDEEGGGVVLWCWCCCLLLLLPLVI